MKILEIVQLSPIQKLATIDANMEPCLNRTTVAIADQDSNVYVYSISISYHDSWKAIFSYQALLTVEYCSPEIDSSEVLIQPMSTKIAHIDKNNPRNRGHGYSTNWLNIVDSADQLISSFVDMTIRQRTGSTSRRFNYKFIIYNYIYITRSIQVNDKEANLKSIIRPRQPVQN